MCSNTLWSSQGKAMTTYLLLAAIAKVKANHMYPRGDNKPSYHMTWFSVTMSDQAAAALQIVQRTGPEARTH